MTIEELMYMLERTIRDLDGNISHIYNVSLTDPIEARYPNGQHVLAPLLAALAQAQAAYANLLIFQKSRVTIINNPPEEGERHE